MKKDEFLKLLRQALAGNVPASVIEENIRYYDSYISDEVRKGALEEEVTGEIGDPRLIAKTIAETTDGTETYTDAYESKNKQNGYGENPYEREPSRPMGGFHIFDMTKWYWKFLAVFVVISVIFIIVSIIGGLFTLLIPLIGPLLMIWVIVWILRLFTRR